MQTLPQSSSNENETCHCTMEQRFAHMGAKLDELMQKADDAQKDLKAKLKDAKAKKEDIVKRTNVALSEMKATSAKVSHELAEIWQTLREGTEKARDSFLPSENNRSEQRKVPCVIHPMHPAELKPSIDDETCECEQQNSP